MPRRTTEPVDTVIFNGVSFRRYPTAENISERTYYTPNGLLRAKGVGRLHQEIWKAANGPIPEGCEIHHTDGNPLNNDLANLACLTEVEHQRWHRKHPRPRTQSAVEHLEAIRPLAAQWHRSEAGRAWHAEHSRDIFDKREPSQLVCQHCGADYRTKHLGDTRFCSNKCKAAARRASGVDNITRTCAVCGKPFTVNKYSRATHCSRSCGKRNKRHRRA